MEKKKINICDVCDKVVAENKCNICNKDLCPKCEGHIQINMYNGERTVYKDKIGICKGCYENIETVSHSEFPKEFVKEVREKFTEQIKKIALIKSLEPKVKKKDNRKTLRGFSNNNLTIDDVKDAMKGIRYEGI